LFKQVALSLLNKIAYPLRLYSNKTALSARTMRTGSAHAYSCPPGPRAQGGLIGRQPL